MTPEKLWLWQREKVLAWLRVGFSLVATFALEISPEREATFPLLSEILLYCFFLYSVGVLYLLIKSTGDSNTATVTTWLDLLWITAIVFFTRSTGGAVFAFYLFPVITASSRHGLRGSLLVAVVGAALYGAISLSPLLEPSIDLGTLALRISYLLILAFIFGYFSDLERGQNQRIALLYKTAAEMAMQEERRRISRDLHDSLIQALASLRLRLEACRKHLVGIPGDLSSELKTMEETVMDSIREIRRFLSGKEGYELRPGSLIERLNEELGFFRDGLGLQVTFENDARNLRLAPEIEKEIYYVMAEGLMNVTKHAHASSLGVSLQRRPSELRGSIKDDGVGFDPADKKDHSYGLQNMIERINKVGGSFTIQSTPGRGTEISFVVPVANGNGLPS